MRKKFNFHSLSFSNDLTDAFDFTSKKIMKIILEGHLSLTSNDNFLKEINEYNKLNIFLGKKRKPSQYLSKEEMDELKKDLNNIQPEKITISESDRIFKIEIDDKNKSHAKLNIFKQPFLIYKIFENINKIDIDLITEKITLINKINDLSKYDCDLYYIFKKGLKTINAVKGIETIETDNLNLSQKKIELKSKDKTSKDKDEEFNFKINPFLIVIKSILPKIEKKDLLYDNIYHKINTDAYLIKPDNISIKFFYYFIINKDLQSKYVFILTEARKKFISFLNNIISGTKYKKIIIIGGPKGIGKTSSLIYFSFINENRVFYINLEALSRNNNELKEKDLLIELSKLYGPYSNNDGGKSKKEIEDYIIDNFNKIDILDLLLNIINKFERFANEYQEDIFCFIIDQISFTQNFQNIIDKLFKIMDIINNCIFLRLIICTTLNNDYSKKSINNIFNNISFGNNRIYDYYYFQNFFSKKDIADNILKEESEEIINTMNELGNLPCHFYEIKRENNIENYIRYVQYMEKNINNDLLNYYEDGKISNILELIDLVFGGKVLSSNLLREKINNIPLKYLVIKKFKINKELIEKYEEQNKSDEFIKYLNLLLYNFKNKENDQIFEEYFDFEEINSINFINEYLEKDKYSRNLFGDFYNDYIKKNNLNFCSPEKEIYAYKIEFSMNFMQKILFNKIYEHLQKEYIIFLKLFSKGSLGGFFEVLINFLFIKNIFKLFNISINQITQIDRIVPFNFSIKHYSSIRKNIKFKKFVIVQNLKKRKLLNENTFIFQNIFNSKYYDLAILIKTNVPNEYDLILIQTTIKKDSDKRFNKFEHEIIITYVKKNIENFFDIKIKNAYFFYILSEKDGEIEDIETKKDCKNKGIKYLSYDIEKKIFNVNCKLEEGFITNTFPIHNAISLYNFKELKGDKKNIINLINRLDFSSFTEIDQETFNLLQFIFKNKNVSDELVKEQFKYGNFIGNIDILKKIDIPLTDFSLYLFKKLTNKIEEIYIKFIDEYYTYKNNKLEIIPSFKLSNIKEFYMIYSEIPLDLNI